MRVGARAQTNRVNLPPPPPSYLLLPTNEAVIAARAVFPVGAASEAAARGSFRRHLVKNILNICSQSMGGGEKLFRSLPIIYSTARPLATYNIIIYNICVYCVYLYKRILL